MTVTDNVIPTITCPAPVVATTNSGCNATNVNLGTPATADNCSVTSIINNHSSSTYPLGITIVTWTVTDASGNTATCAQTVTVSDNVNPTITCPASVTATTNSGCTATGVNLGTPVTADNCTVASVTNNAPAAFPLGTTTVTWTVKDGSGNTATCTQTVKVTDNINPTIVCPANKTVAPISLSGTVVNFATPAGSDNCSVTSVVQTAGLASGSTFPIGTSTVSFKVTDGSGNTATCSFTITVINPYCDNNPNNKKVYVCHNGNTICISVNALQTHMSHGDYLGTCSPVTSNLYTSMDDGPVVNANATTNVTVITKETQTVKITPAKLFTPEKLTLVASPNPSSTDFKLEILSKENETAVINIIDMAGRVIKTYNGVSKNQVITVGGEFKSGVYFAEVKQGNQKAIVKIIKL